MEAVRHVPAVVDVVEDRRGGKAVATTAKAVPGAFVHRPVHHHYFGHAGGHGHCRMHDRGASGAAAVGYLGEELDVLAAQQAGDFVLRDLVHRIGAEALYFRRVDAGVAQRLKGGFEGQAQFGAPGVLGKLGGAQPDNRGAPGNRKVVHAASAGHGSTSATVPVTWLPMEFLPLRVTSTVRVSGSWRVTLPLKVMQSPG
ncbi:hypothetical protein D3C76_683220 [compost metagenome]